MKLVFKILLLILVCKGNLILGQHMENSFILTNDSIKYKILLTGGPLEKGNKYKPSKYAVVMSLSKEVKEEYKKMTYDKWVNLLSESNTDWSSNIILYWLFDKDANKLEIGKDKWKETRKKKDLDAWNNFLKENLKKANWDR